MRILILNHNLREKGTYFRAWPIAKDLSRRGWDVTFVTVSGLRLYRTTIRYEHNIRIFETPRWTWPGIEADDGWGPLGVLRRARLALFDQFDWVYSFAHTPNCYLPARIASGLRGARLAVDWCDDFRLGVFPSRREHRARDLKRSKIKDAIQRRVEDREAKAESEILRRADKVTVISDHLLQRAADEGVAPDKIMRIWSGADDALFRPRPKEEARAKFNLPPDIPLLAYIANYHPDDLFLHAALEIVFRENSAARLIYTGPLLGGEALRNSPVAARTIPLGRLEAADVPWALSAADAALVPLDDTAHNRARCPQKLMDCLASATPVVTCDVGETGNIFRRYRGIGYATPPTPEDYARGILDMLELPPAKRAEIGRAARFATELEFNWMRAGAQVEKFLKDEA